MNHNFTVIEYRLSPSRVKKRQRQQISVDNYDALKITSIHISELMVARATTSSNWELAGQGCVVK